MTAIRKVSIGYLIVRLIAITILVVPPLTGIFTFLVACMFYPGYGDLHFLFLPMAWAMFGYTWTMLLLVLTLYSIFYGYLGDKSLWLKLLVFYGLMVLPGVIAPELSVTGSFISDQYPKVLVLHLLLTVTICPLVNIPLNKMVSNREGSLSEGEAI